MALTHAQVEFIRGDTWDILGTLFDSDGVTPLDLNGSPVIEWTIATADGSFTLTLTLGAGITITSVPLAQILIRVSPTQSRTVPVGVHTDQCKVVVSATGFQTTQWEGSIKVKPTINP